jgi:uncharacterized membrane protein YbaN (DUF454 family)
LIRKNAYLILGSFFLILAVLGIFLPLLPATPLALLSSYFFSRSSPRLNRWLLGLPVLGTLISDWHQHHVISPRSKFLAVSVIGISYGFLWRKETIPFFAKIIVLIILISVIIFILSKKSYPS